MSRSHKSRKQKNLDERPRSWESDPKWWVQDLHVRNKAKYKQCIKTENYEDIENKVVKFGVYWH